MESKGPMFPGLEVWFGFDPYTTGGLMCVNLMMVVPSLGGLKQWTPFHLLTYLNWILVLLNILLHL